MGFRRLSSSVTRQISHSRKLSGPCISMSEAKSAKQGDGNPNPLRFTVERSEKVGLFYVSVVRYPDCYNYEGKKILLFRNTTMLELLSQGSIDPHFSNNNKFRSPYARFEPSETGWEDAKMFAKEIL